MWDRDGRLHARAAADQRRLDRLVGAALPAAGAVAVSGSMMLRRSSVVPPFVVHVKPVGVPHPDYGARHVAALVLIVEPGRHPRINPALVATTLELTPAETQVAVGLAEGKRVREMAEATGHTPAAIYWHRCLRDAPCRTARHEHAADLQPTVPARPAEKHLRQRCDRRKTRLSSCPQSASVPAPRPETPENRRTPYAGPWGARERETSSPIFTVACRECQVARGLAPEPVEVP